LPGVHAGRVYPSEAGQPHGRAAVRLSPASGWDRDELVKALWSGDPRIAVGTIGDDTIALNPQTLQPGEHTIVLAALLHHLAGRNR
ncbi:MAG: hypothetical protein ACRDPR_17715, partial [Nocardioidaceae bacterium]